MKRIMMRLEPELDGIEVAYRQHYLRGDIDLVNIGIMLWILPYLGFAYTDYLIYGLIPLFFQLLLMRMFFVLLTVGVVWQLKLHVTHFKAFDRWVLFWAIFSVGWIFLIDLIRPQDDYAPVVVNLVFLLSFYVFIPNRFAVRVIPALLFSCLSLLEVTIFKSRISLSMLNATIFSVCFADTIGILFSTRLYNSRRKEYLAHLEEENIRAELQRLASTDPLTGVLNRRRLLEIAGESFYRLRRYHRPCSILVMDLDGFKKVNDTLGHQQGDSMLIRFAESVHHEKRAGDALGRMGGDEFCLVLPETQSNVATALAERILQNCGNIVAADDNQQINVTVSIGISEARHEDSSLDSVFARADAALYAAKHGGRNRWETA